MIGGATTATQRCIDYTWVAAEQIIAPERGWPLSQLVSMNRRLDVIAAPGRLNRWADKRPRPCPIIS
jgi:hypothetical protein